MTAELANMTPAEILAARVKETGPDWGDARHYVSLEAMSAAASFIRREWGDYGYSLGIVASSMGNGLFQAIHSDGSRFYITADRYGNTAEVTL